MTNTPPQPGDRYSDAEIAALRRQKARMVADARAEQDRRGGRAVHPRILAARAAGRNV